jgi:hypothetical protein
MGGLWGSSRSSSIRGCDVSFAARAEGRRFRASSARERMTSERVLGFFGVEAHNPLKQPRRDTTWIMKPRVC